MVATQAPVVARSPDLATRPTAGLPARLPPGDLRSRSRRGRETRAEPSPARNRQVIPGPFLKAVERSLNHSSSTSHTLADRASGMATFGTGARVLAEWFGEWWQAAGGEALPIPA